MILFLTACATSELPLTTQTPDPAVLAEFGPVGAAPWDPFWVEASPEEVGQLAVFDEGGPVAMTPLVVPDYVSADAGLYRYEQEPVDVSMDALGAWVAPAGDLWQDVPTPPQFVPAAVSWEVGHHGRGASFDPVGRWAITPGLVLGGGRTTLSAVIASSIPALHLEVLDAADGVATFRLVSVIYGSTDECVLLEDRAALSETGELTWSMDRIEAITEPAPLVLYAPRLRIGFDEETAAGGEVSTIADVRATAGTNADVCALSSSFGAECQPCADDGNPSCLALAGYGWTATRVDEPIDEALPICGADFTDTGTFPDWSFDIDCGDWSGTLCAGVSLLFLAPLARRRQA